MNEELLKALNELCAERGLEKDVIRREKRADRTVDNA